VVRATLWCPRGFARSTCPMSGRGCRDPWVQPSLMPAVDEVLIFGSCEWRRRFTLDDAGELIGPYFGNAE
jgi:hypothetical protein